MILPQSQRLWRPKHYMTLLQGRLEKSASTRVIPFLWQDKCQMIGGKGLWEVKKVLSRTNTSCSEWSKSFYLVWVSWNYSYIQKIQYYNDLSGFHKSVSHLKFKVKWSLISTTWIFQAGRAIVRFAGATKLKPNYFKKQCSSSSGFSYLR